MANPVEAWWCNEYLRSTETAWTAYKFRSPGRRGVPDRLVLGPDGAHLFVEFKRPGEPLTPWQHREIRKLLTNRHLVYVVSNREQAKEILSDYDSNRRNPAAYDPSRALLLDPDGERKDRYRPRRRR